MATVTSTSSLKKDKLYWFRAFCSRKKKARKKDETYPYGKPEMTDCCPVTRNIADSGSNRISFFFCNIVRNHFKGRQAMKFTHYAWCCTQTLGLTLHGLRLKTTSILLLSLQSRFACSLSLAFALCLESPCWFEKYGSAKLTAMFTPLSFLHGIFHNKYGNDTFSLCYYRVLETPSVKIWKIRRLKLWKIWLAYCKCSHSISHFSKLLPLGPFYNSIEQFLNITL